jgi:energy-coupling factor transporter ATP-binding protein EcfA2
MKISELPEYLELIPPTQAVLILGPPGCGKSTAVREFAEKEAEKIGREFLEYDDDDEVFIKVTKAPEKYYLFLDIRLSETEPTDFLGVPRDMDHFIVYKPLRWVQAFSNRNTAGVIVLDELTNVRREDVLAQAYKLVLDRKAGFRRFSDNVRIIGAGNSPETSSIANLLPAPLANRFAIFNIYAGDVYEWIDYVNSREGGIVDFIAGYLVRFPTDLTIKSDAETLENFPTRRAFSRLNMIVRENKINVKRLEKLATALLGQTVATKLVAFYKLHSYLPTPERLLSNPQLLDTAINKAKADGINELDIIYYAVASVSSYVTHSADLNVDGVFDMKDFAKFVMKIAEIQQDLLVVLLKLMPEDKRKKMILSLSNMKEVQTAVNSIAKYL